MVPGLFSTFKNLNKMKTKKPILKINNSGELVEFNNLLKRWEIVSRSWSWSDITTGYIRESKKNYKKSKQ